jgi:hypothetical protein
MRLEMNRTLASTSSHCQGYDDQQAVETEYLLKAHDYKCIKPLEEDANYKEE